MAAHAGWVAAAQGRMAVHMANRAAEPPLPSKAIALHQMQALCAQYYPLFAATCPRGEMPPHSGAGHEHPVGELLPKNRNAVFLPCGCV